MSIEDDENSVSVEGETGQPASFVIIAMIVIFVIIVTFVITVTIVILQKRSRANVVIKV